MTDFTAEALVEAFTALGERALAVGFYPEARVSGKLALALDHLWTEYRRRRSEKGRDAPRYLGRSGA